MTKLSTNSLIIAELFRQGSTVIVKSLHMIMYSCQNFDKYQKTDIMHHTFYLAIFLTICPKLVLI